MIKKSSWSRLVEGHRSQKKQYEQRHWGQRQYEMFEKVQVVCGEIGGVEICGRAEGWPRGAEHKGDKIGEINRS